MSFAANKANLRHVPSDNVPAKLFGLDLRSLAAFRIGVGLLLLIGLAYRLEDLSAHYTDAGSLPRAARMCLNVHEQFTAPPYWMSLHMLSGESWFQGLLFAISAILAVCVVVGYRTTYVMFASWVLLISLQARNPLVLQGGDDLLRVMLLWSCLIPCGAAWSLDARRRKCQIDHPYVSLATAGLVIQLALMYIATALLKTGPAWRVNFDALYYSLAMDHFTKPFGYWLLSYPVALKILTAATMVLEFFGPLLLFVPWRNSLLRLLVFIGFVGLHVGIALTMQIGMFPWICIVCWLIVLPSAFWKSKPMQAIIGLVRGTFPRRRGDGQEAAVGLPVPRALGWFGNSVCAILLLYIVLINGVRLHGGVRSTLNAGPVRFLGTTFTLDQYWCMFSPGPQQFGGWLRIEGVTADGKRVNLVAPDREAFLTKPGDVCGTYPSQRWRKYLMNLIERDCPVHRTALTDYLVRRWHAQHRHATEITAVEIICMCAPTPPPLDTNRADEDLQPVLIWRRKMI